MAEKNEYDYLMEGLSVDEQMTVKKDNKGILTGPYGVVIDPKEEKAFKNNKSIAKKLGIILSSNTTVEDFRKVAIEIAKQNAKILQQSIPEYDQLKPEYKYILLDSKHHTGVTYKNLAKDLLAHQNNPTPETLLAVVKDSRRVDKIKGVDKTSAGFDNRSAKVLRRANLINNIEQAKRLGLSKTNEKAGLNLIKPFDFIEVVPAKLAEKKQEEFTPMDTRPDSFFPIEEGEKVQYADQPGLIEDTGTLPEEDQTREVLLKDVEGFQGENPFIPDFLEKMFSSTKEKVPKTKDEIEQRKKQFYERLQNKMSTGGQPELKENMAEGGAVPMEKQMSMFDDGGLMDEGGTIDPVSGNDVPVGSTQKEVRDDIPAQLSEGEFVFPADVVRYIGLEKLMQMRQEAKRGLDMMDKMGQMGNADEAVIPDDIPFELSDLDMEDDPVEMQQGGVAGVSYVPSQVQPSGRMLPISDDNLKAVPFESPSSTQASVPIAPTYTPPTQQEVPTFAPEDMQDVSFPGVVQTPESTPQLVEIVNPTTGERRTINYIPGVTVLPEGFVLASEYDGSAQATSVTPVVGQAQVREDTTSERRKDEAARAKMELDNARLNMAQELFPFTKPADPFSVSTALGKLEPGTRTATGYIIGDNGEYLDPLTGEQAFFGFESAKYALSPEDKPELKIKSGGINEKFVQTMIEQERTGRDRLDKAMIDRQIARQTSLAGQKKAAKKTFDAQRSAKTAKEVADARAKKQDKKDRDKRIKELEKETKQMTAYEGGIKKGGLLTKTKPKPKKMRQGGLASR